VLRPVCKIIMDVQGNNISIADVMRFNLYLGQILSKELSNPKLPPYFVYDVVVAYRKRMRDMDCSLYVLALFMDPRFRCVLSPDPPGRHNELWATIRYQVSKLSFFLLLLAKDEFLLFLKILCRNWQACSILVARDFPMAEEATLKPFLEGMNAYRAGAAPYNIPYTSSHTPKLWWEEVDRAGSGAASRLVLLVAQKLLVPAPHSAAPERAFSMMGWFHSDLRNRMSVETTKMLTAIKMHYLAEGEAALPEAAQEVCKGVKRASKRAAAPPSKKPRAAAVAPVAHEPLALSDGADVDFDTAAEMAAAALADMDVTCDADLAELTRLMAGEPEQTFTEPEDGDSDGEAAAEELADAAATAAAAAAAAELACLEAAAAAARVQPLLDGLRTAWPGLELQSKVLEPTYEWPQGVAVPLGARDFGGATIDRRATLSTVWDLLKH